jgi:DNA repair exonuclease SbcCD ATPase subunit
MATPVAQNRCVTCEMSKASYKCEGCQRFFCLRHLSDHIQELIQQLDKIENQRNIFKQTLEEQIKHPLEYFLVQQIDQWETKSIQTIKQRANEAKYITHGYFEKIEMNLQSLTEKIEEYQNENDFNETNVNQLKSQLADLEKQLNQPENIRIEEGSTLIKKINVITSFSRKFHLF